MLRKLEMKKLEILL